MPSKKVMLGSGSVVPHVMVDSKSTIFLPKNKQLLELLANALVVRDTYGELVIACGYAIPNGIGRSVRAAVLGIEYKGTRRVCGTFGQFSPSMFNLPQDGSALQKRMKKKQVQRSRATVHRTVARASA